MKQIIELKKQDTFQLNKELSQLFREQFNLRMQSSSGKLKQPHLLRKVRRKIAQIKTLLTEKNG